MAGRLGRPATGAAVALTAVVVTTLLVYPLREIAPVVALGVLYLLAVLLVSSVWGAVLGLATALASALAFNFFHIPPTGRFTIAEAENWVALAVFFVVAIVVSQLAEQARRRPRRPSEVGTKPTWRPRWPGCCSAGRAWRTPCERWANASRARWTCPRSRSSAAG